MARAMSGSRAPLVVGSALLLMALAVLAGQEGPPGAPPSPSGPKAEAFGRLFCLDLVAAPFPHRARNAGFTYEGDYIPRQGHYDDPSVSVFIPAGLQPTGKVDLVFFFHGWYSSVAEAERDFDLFRQFSASGVKAILVLPETAREAPGSFGGKLEDEDGFTALVDELLVRLHSEGATPRLRAGRIALLGHSGAYHVIARILGQGGAAAKVAEVCLFDALYGDLEAFSDWAQSAKGSFVSISSEGGEPADNALDMALSLRKAGFEVEEGRDDPGADALLAHRIVFLTSAYDHGSLVVQGDELRRVLAAAFAGR